MRKFFDKLTSRKNCLTQNGYNQCAYSLLVIGVGRGKDLRAAIEAHKNGLTVPSSANQSSGRFIPKKYADNPEKYDLWYQNKKTQPPS